MENENINMSGNAPDGVTVSEPTQPTERVESPGSPAVTPVTPNAPALEVWAEPVLEGSATPAATPTIESLPRPESAPMVLPAEPIPAPVLKTPATEIAPNILNIPSAPTATVSAAPTEPEDLSKTSTPVRQESTASSSEPKPTPAPLVNLKLFLNKALEKIRFRKKAKLEKIVKFSQDKGSITNDQAQKLLRISDATATRYLKELVKNGRLRQMGVRGGARYEPMIGSNGGN